MGTGADKLLQRLDLISFTEYLLVNDKILRYCTSASGWFIMSTKWHGLELFAVDSLKEKMKCLVFGWMGERNP